MEYSSKNTFTLSLRRDWVTISFGNFSATHHPSRRRATGCAAEADLLLPRRDEMVTNFIHKERRERRRILFYSERCPISKIQFRLFLQNWDLSPTCLGRCFSLLTAKQTCRGRGLQIHMSESLRGEMMVRLRSGLHQFATAVEDSRPLPFKILDNLLCFSSKEFEISEVRTAKGRNFWT